MAKNVHLYLKDDERQVILNLVKKEIAEQQDMWSDAASAGQDVNRKAIQKHIMWLFALEEKLDDASEEATAVQEVEG